MKAWLWLKEHWKMAAIFVWTVVVWVVSRKNSAKAEETLRARKESYNKQIALLKSKHNKELNEKDKLILQYHDTIDKLEKAFEEAEQELTKKHVNEVKEIVSKSNGNPDEVKKRIEEEFGIKFRN